MSAVGLTLASTTPGLAQSTGPFDLNQTTIDDLHAALRSRRVTCRSVVEHYLRRIDAYDQRGPALNALVTVNPRAVAEAERLDASQQDSVPLRPLHCVPVLVKDAFDTADMRTTYGSAAFKTFTPAQDATVVALLKRAGALVIGKATLGEFASGYAGSVSGPIRSPYDPRRHPSGSSGGTGAGIAADFAVAGIGGDTGGSVRGPAAVNSLVGLRPTLPLVSRAGSVPFKPSYDAVGPLTRTVMDTARVMDVIAGYDPSDPVTAYAVGRTPRSYAEGLVSSAMKGRRVGVIRHPMHRETDSFAADHRSIRAVFERAVGELGNLGAVVEEVAIPSVGERTRESYEANIFETEAAIDGFLGQHSNAPIKTLRELLLTPGALLPWRAKALMNTVGRNTNEAGYLQALKNTEDLRRMVLTLMADQRLDALVYPSADHYPALIASDIATNPDVVGDTRFGSNRTLAAVLGFPAITVPAGLTDDGMPVGLEFLSRAFDDAGLLGYAFAYEQATRHRRAPSTTPPLAR